MRKTEDLHLVLRTNGESGDSISDYLPRIQAALKGTGLHLSVDERRDSQAALTLPPHFCTIRARSMMRRLMMSVTDMHGNPQLEVKLVTGEPSRSEACSRRARRHQSGKTMPAAHG